MFCSTSAWHSGGWFNLGIARGPTCHRARALPDSAENGMTLLKKSLVTGLAALTLATSVAASTTPAAAWWRGGWGWGPGPVAAGVIGGLAAGAIIAGATRPYY